MAVYWTGLSIPTTRQPHLSITHSPPEGEAGIADSDRSQKSSRGRSPRRAWFASDFHLHEGDPAGVERACQFVAHVREQDAEALFLLGDVFRAWLGRSSLEEAGLAPFFDALRGASESGMRVVLLHGNHDFLMGAELEDACGVEVYRESLDISVQGKRVRLMHGDAFCTRDVSFQRLHKVLRAKPMRWVFGKLPQRTLGALAHRLVHDATRTTGEKSQMTMAIVDAEVVDVLCAGADVVVCGHVHEARDELLGGEGASGRLVVMADFERTGSHACIEGGHIVLHRADARFAPATSESIVVTLDGPAGSGKSSVARELARRLGFPLLDSGALYRTVAAQALAAGLDPGKDDLAPLARSLELGLGEGGRVTLAGELVSDALLRSSDVSAVVSKVSAQPGVRAALLPVQRAAGRIGPGLVAEGRDMASVVFPEAAVRVFLDARPEVRAQRRLEQNPGEGATLTEVSAALAARDARDSGRSHAPLTLAEGATLLDTSELDLEQVVSRLSDMVLEATRLR